MTKIKKIFKTKNSSNINSKKYIFFYAFKGSFFFFLYLRRITSFDMTNGVQHPKMFIYNKKKNISYCDIFSSIAFFVKKEGRKRSEENRSIRVRYFLCTLARAKLQE